MALRIGPDRGDLFVGDAAGDEPHQPLAVVADHTEGAVAGAGEFAGGGDDVVEGAGQVKIGADADHRVEQRPETFLGVHDLVDTAQQLLQQGVQADPRQPRELQRTFVPCPRLLRAPMSPTYGSPTADVNRLGHTQRHCFHRE